MIALLWTFPLLMIASIVIGWAAEITAVQLSAGIALAVLAWLQTAPEFAVEATIAWHHEAHLALANLTGSLRLLLGLGWPMVFFVYWFFSKKRSPSKSRKRAITLPKSFSVEATALVIPVLYFLAIYFNKSWSAIDGMILCALYAFYFWMLNRQRKLSTNEDEQEEAAEEDEPWVIRKVLSLKGTLRYFWISVMFAGGAVALYWSVHPFVEALKNTALKLGISEYVFIQWIAPVASEFPEKVTAFNWARKPGKAPMALVNMLSSITSQWTLLAGLVPIVFSLSAGHLYTLHLTSFQRTELLLTVAQAALAVAFLADLKVTAFESAGLFALWLLQLFWPHAYVVVIPIYFGWAFIELIRLAAGSSSFLAWRALRGVFFSGM